MKYLFISLICNNKMFFLITVQKQKFVNKKHEFYKLNLNIDFLSIFLGIIHNLNFYSMIYSIFYVNNILLMVFILIYKLYIIIFIE